MRLILRPLFSRSCATGLLRTRFKLKDRINGLSQGSVLALLGIDHFENAADSMCANTEDGIKDNFKCFFFF